MNIDPKKLNALAQPATSKSRVSKTKADSTVDTKLLATFAIKETETTHPIVCQKGLQSLLDLKI